MKLHIIKGLNVISIGLNDIGSYFKLKRPVALVWSDCEGYIGQYTCLLPIKEDERQILHQLIPTNLTGNFSYKEELLYNVLKPLFTLLENGEYYFGFSDGHHSEYWVTYSGAYQTEHEPKWALYFPEAVKLEDTLKIKTQHQLDKVKNISERRYRNLVETTTTSIYNWGNDFYVATKPITEIDESRVAYFEQKIISGERPFAIILSAEYGDNNVASFVLDGHHKLLAYERLSLNPPIAYIKRIYKSIDEIEFDVEKLRELLYPWQFEHLLKNSEGLEKVLDIENYLKYYNDKLVRNGEYKEFYENKQLSFKATYKNGIPNGPMRAWHPNGRLKSKYHFRAGVKVGLWRQWHDSGQLKAYYRFNENGQYHGFKQKYAENGGWTKTENWVNGLHADGWAYEADHRSNYYKQTYFKDSRIKEIKCFSNGRLSSHQKYSNEEKKLIDIPIPERVKAADYTSPVYQQKANTSRRSEWISSLAFIAFFIFIIAILIKSLTPTNKTPAQRRNIYSDKNNGVLERENFYKEEQQINLLNFEEARQHPLGGDTDKDKNNDTFLFKAYVRPFFSSVFEKTNDAIVKTDTTLTINNKTNKEIALIAWYKGNLRHQSLPLIYAVYIPPKHKIKIDFEMYKMVFYAGNDLDRFNSYRKYQYEDSLDYKFRRTSVADSILLKTSFSIDDDKSLKAKEQELTIEQTVRNNYMITWDAKMELYASEKSLLENGKWVVNETIEPGGKYHLYPGKFSPSINNKKVYPLNIKTDGFEKEWKQSKIFNIYLANILSSNKMDFEGELFYRFSLKNNQIVLVKIVPEKGSSFFYLIDRTKATSRKVHFKEG